MSALLVKFSPVIVLLSGVLVPMSCHNHGLSVDVGERAQKYNFPMNYTDVQRLVQRFSDRFKCDGKNVSSDKHGCFTCNLDADWLFAVLRLTRGVLLDKSRYQDTAVLLLYRSLEPSLSCRDVCTNYKCAETVLNQDFGLDGRNYVDADLVDRILTRVNVMYTPSNKLKCFSATELFGDLRITNTSKGLPGRQLPLLIESLFNRLVNGECISTEDVSPTFLNAIYRKYASSSSGLTPEDLHKLMHDLGLLHAEQDSVIVADPKSAIPDAFNDRDFDPWMVASTNVRNESLDHPGHSHAQPVWQRSRRQATHTHDHAHNSTAHAEDELVECYSADALIGKFDRDESSHLSKDEFIRLCPALIAQSVDGVCRQSMALAVDPWEVYGYGTLAILVISLCSLVVLSVIPLLTSNIYQYAMACFIALAFGTMNGDAFLHLIPQALGLHKHDEEGKGGSHSHGESEGLFDDIPSYMWTCIALLLTIYALFLFEMVSTKLFKGGHGHSHGEQNGSHSHVPDPNTFLKSQSANKKKANKTISRETLNSVSSFTNGNGPPSPGVFLPELPEIEESAQPEVIVMGLTSLALMIIVGDAMHNLGDGMAVGAAFSTGLRGGLSTSIAVLFHELPHEFGDVVILLSTGMSMKRAIMWNFVTAIFAFAGLYIGILLGENEMARLWVFAITAGMFIYIAIGDMLPELKNQQGPNKYLTFLAQNVGVVLGMLAMLAMALFEDKIKI